MKSLNAYRLAGILGGLMLAAGQFWGPACILQLAALLPLMLLVLRDRRIRFAALAGLYMGIAFTFPQMIYLRMPLPVTVVLLVWFTLLLVALCMAAAYLLPRHPVLGPLAFAAFWYILDWTNYTAVPVSRGRALDRPCILSTYQRTGHVSNRCKGGPRNWFLSGEDRRKEDWSWRESNPHHRIANAVYSHYTTAPKYGRTGFEGGILHETVGKSTLYLRFFHIPAKTG